MNGRLLRALSESLSQARAVVLVRPIESGADFLVDRSGVTAFGEMAFGATSRGVTAFGATGEGSQATLPRELLEFCRDALARDDARTVEVEQGRYLIQTIAPPPRLIVVGAVHIAQKLIPMAQLAGYRVLLLDPREAFATGRRFPDVEISHDWPQQAMPSLALDARTAVVTLSHDAKIDEPALKCALQSNAFYIGALGSRKNHAKRLQRLSTLGFDDEALARIHGPIGLPLGGRSPAEIAVAILAQMTQARYARMPS